MKNKVPTPEEMALQVFRDFYPGNENEPDSWVHENNHDILHTIIAERKRIKELIPPEEIECDVACKADEYIYERTVNMMRRQWLKALGEPHDM